MGKIDKNRKIGEGSKNFVKFFSGRSIYRGAILTRSATTLKSGPDRIFLAEQFFKIPRLQLCSKPQVEMMHIFNIAMFVLAKKNGQNEKQTLENKY